MTQGHNAHFRESESGHHGRLVGGRETECRKTGEEVGAIFSCISRHEVMKR